jgi:hypothetical protein
MDLLNFSYASSGADPLPDLGGRDQSFVINSN